jgi:signal transduction histidine kinase
MSRLGVDIGVDDVPQATIVVGADRRVQAANTEAAALTGRPVAQLVGIVVDELIGSLAGGELPSWHDGWDRSAQLPSVRGFPEVEVGIRTLDGRRVDAVVTGRYVRDGGGRLSSVVITARPTVRRGRDEPTAIEVVSTVSHELRSPLTSVKGYTSLLLNRWDRISDEQKRTMLTQINHDADRVTRLITELLDISRLETGRLHLRRQQVDLVALARAVVDRLSFEYAGLDCTIDFTDGFPPVYADRDKVEQVLTNLVENAAKYASPIGMRIEGTTNGDEVAVAVADRGAGIPGADLRRVFTKFFRRESGRPTGSGLGLWISRGLVEAHGGRLTATSIEGQGSVFRFTLPTDAFERLHA